MSKNYSEVRKPDKRETSRNIHSEYRRKDQSRERSRDDAKSKVSNSSQRSNRSGPTIFGGNVLLKKTKPV